MKQREMLTMLSLGLAVLVSLLFSGGGLALEVPTLHLGVNDFAKMMPAASVDDMAERLRRDRVQTGHAVVVLTVQTLEGEDVVSFGRKAFKTLPLTGEDLQRSALLVVARNEKQVGFEAGSELQPLFPQPRANRKLQEQAEIYFSGMRPDLGIHAAVHYIFGVIRGEFRIDRKSEEERLEDASKRGANAGAIFALLLGPFLAFFAGTLWGVYATDYGIQRETRLFIGAVLGGGTAKLVSILMSMMGSFGDGLWYFILGLSVPLAAFGSLTEYWMAGDWRGIPAIKSETHRKPEDNMGI